LHHGRPGCGAPGFDDATGAAGAGVVRQLIDRDGADVAHGDEVLQIFLGRDALDGRPYEVFLDGGEVGQRHRADKPVAGIDGRDRFERIEVEAETSIPARECVVVSGEKIIHGRRSSGLDCRRRQGGRQVGRPGQPGHRLQGRARPRAR